MKRASTIRIANDNNNDDSTNTDDDERINHSIYFVQSSPLCKC